MTAIVCFQDPVLLQARVVRNVDGMDMDLFEGALKIRRNFEAELKEKTGRPGALSDGIHNALTG